MKVFSHVSNTWLLAQIIHPLVFFLCFSFLWHDTPDIGMLLALFIGSAVFSLPSLGLCLLFIRIIPVAKLSEEANLFIWLLLVITSISVNISLLLFVGGTAHLFREWNFFLPAVLAAVLSVAIRYKSFTNFLNLQNNDDED